MNRSDRKRQPLHVARKITVWVLVFIAALVFDVFIAIEARDTINHFSYYDFFKKTITVEKVETISRPVRYKTSYTFIVYSDGEGYRFSGGNRLVEYGPRELEKIVLVGDRLEIDYFVKMGDNVVIGAKRGDFILRSTQSFHDYQDSQKGFAIVGLVGSQLTLIGLLSFAIWDCRDPVKTYFRRKRTQEKRERRKKERQEKRERGEL